MTRRLVSLAAVALLALTACSPTTTVTPGDWPQFHDGPTLQGHNTQETILSPATVPHIGVMWVGLTGGPINS
jgi:outer membrane biogenesis lipoprotein LolB